MVNYFSNLKKQRSNSVNQNGEVSPRVRKIITIVLLGSCFISLASQTMMVTALPVIQEDLHVSLNAV